MPYQNYYQSAAPSTWGTSNFRFGSPPTPGFQPQSSWGGLDYYRAHALSPDPSLYQHAWNRLSSHPGDGGVGMHEARHWHRLAYGGMGEAQTMSPYEIGHAAAYEAYRTWIHNSSIYEPISSDHMRQREALIGLAVAEVSRLWHFTGRVPDTYSRREACESAAATASVLFNLFVDDDYGEMPYSGHSTRNRSGSFSNYPAESYAYDDDVWPRRHGYQRRRHSSSSSMGRPTIVPPGSSPYYGTNPIPIPGSSGYGGSYGRSSPYDVGGIGTSPYNALGTSPYGPGSYPIQPAYSQAVGFPASQPSTVIIERSSGHKHRSGHKHHSRRHRTYSDASYPILPTTLVPSYRY
jgi:hypothetical protein